MRATNALVSFCTRTLGGQADEDVKAEPPSAEDIDIIELYVARERKRQKSQTSETTKRKNEK